MRGEVAGGAAEARPRLGVVLVGALLLLWPTVLNWHPYLFWDSYGYFLQGKAYTRLILGWVGLLPVPPEAAAGWVGAAARMLAADASIRSPTFSLLFYAVTAVGGFWLVAATSALVASATVELALARLFGLSARRRLLAFLILSLASTLPWFASYLMPDLYAGLLILAAATLAFAWGRLTRWERAGLVALHLLAASFHSSHLLLAAGLAVFAAALAPPGMRRRAGMGLGLLAASAMALLVAAGWLGFGRLTPAPQAPPFLLARSWEDGPARLYLEAACGRGEAFAICRHLATLPPTAQELLWNPTRSYWAMSLADRAAVRDEEKAIVMRAVLARPLLQAEAALRNGAIQLARFGLDDHVVGRGAAVTLEDYTFVYLPQAPAALWGLGGFSAFLYGVTALGLLALLAWLLRQGDERAWRLSAVALLGIISNALICGALSGPNDRYQARVIWLVPVLAAGFLLSPARPAPGRGGP